MKKANILAVDDLPANLIALEAVLSDEYNVICANSGAESISILEKRHDISVILMDLQMPQMDGFETAKRIKQLEGSKDIPIIFITAIYTESPFVRKGYEAGAVDYFSKPFDPEILRMKLRIYSAFRQKAFVLKERERQIRETEDLLKVGRKLSGIFEGLPVGVLVADVDGRICQTNEVVSKICRATEPMDRDAYGEILGWWDGKGRVIKDSDGPLANAIHFGAITHNKIMQIQCFDGSHTTVFCSASPLLGMDRSIVGAVVVIQDVSESKKIEQDLEQKIANLVSLGIDLEHARH